MIKYLTTMLAALFLYSGCATPNYVTKHGLRIFGNAKVSPEKIEDATEMLLQTLGEDSETVSGTDVWIYTQPLCLQSGNMMIIADGWTVYNNLVLWVKPSVYVSTVRACFDGLIHELGHVIQVKRTGEIPDTKFGDIHEDPLYWKAVGSVIRWTVGELCGGARLEISPKVCE